MAPRNDPPAILRSLAALESAIGSLYAALGHCFTDEQDFWAGLCAAEQSHARLLLGLIPLVEQGKVTFDAERFDPMSIALAQRSVKEHTEVVRAKTPCREDALALAMSIERSMLEDRFFDLGDRDNPRIKEVLEVLDRETREHRAQLERRLNEARGKG